MAGKARTMRMSPENLEEAIAKREAEAAASEVVIPEGVQAGESLYVARPQGRHVPIRKHIVDEEGKGRTVVIDHYYTAFYGPFEDAAAVEVWLRHKRSRGTIDFVEGVKVVTEREARAIKRREEGDDLVG